MYGRGERGRTRTSHSLSAPLPSPNPPALRCSGWRSPGCCWQVRSVADGNSPLAVVGARLKCHRVCKVEMTPGRRGGLTRPHLSPEFCAMDAPLSAYLAPPDCLAAAGVVDRPADGSADMKLAARARMPAPR